MPCVSFLRGVLRFHLMSALVTLPAIAEEPSFALKKSELLTLANKAALAIRWHDRTVGGAYLRAAIALHPGDIGNRWEPPTGVADVHVLREGTTQFERLTRDRPRFLSYSREPGFGALRSWAIRQLGGEFTGKPIAWDSSSPVSSADLYHVMPAAAFRVGHTKDPFVGTIQISERDRQTNAYLDFDDLWCKLVFECFNARNADAYEDLEVLIGSGLLSRDQAIEEFVRMELRTVQLTRAFYAKVFLPFAEKTHFRTLPVRWYVLDPRMWMSSPREIMTATPKDRTWPWRFYGDAYDMIRRETESAVSPQESQSPLHHSRLLAQKGRSALRADDLRGARRYFRAAIWLNSADAGNATAHISTLGLSKADIDFGRKQFRRLMADRPQIGLYQHLGSFFRLRRWASLRMAGAADEMKVLWDPHGDEVCNVAAVPDMRTEGGMSMGIDRIYIAPARDAELSDDGAAAFDRMWGDLAFELGNATVSEDVSKVEFRVMSGRMSRDDYIRAMLTLHLQAAQVARGFFVVFYLPLAEEAGIRVAPKNWPLGDSTWGTAESILDRATWIREHYGNCYDRLRREAKTRQRQSGDGGTNDGKSTENAPKRVKE